MRILAQESRGRWQFLRVFTLEPVFSLGKVVLPGMWGAQSLGKKIKHHYKQNKTTQTSFSTHEKYKLESFSGGIYFLLLVFPGEDSLLLAF